MGYMDASVTHLHSTAIWLSVTHLHSTANWLSALRPCNNSLWGHKRVKVTANAGIAIGYIAGNNDWVCSIPWSALQLWGKVWFQQAGIQVSLHSYLVHFMTCTKIITIIVALWSLVWRKKKKHTVGSHCVPLVTTPRPVMLRCSDATLVFVMTA